MTATPPLTLETKTEKAFIALLSESDILKGIGFIQNDSEEVKDVKILVCASKGGENVPNSNVWNMEVEITAKSRVKREGQGPDRLDEIAAQIELTLATKQETPTPLHSRLTAAGFSLKCHWTEAQGGDREPRGGNYNVREYRWRVVAANT